MILVRRAGRVHRKGFTLLELLFVVAIIGIVTAMAIPRWVTMSQTYHLRSDADRISGLINAYRMRGTSNFARTTITCGTNSQCPGSGLGCTATMQNYTIVTGSGSTISDATPQLACLSPDVQFAVPTSTSVGVQGQYSGTPTQTLTLTFNSMGLPISSSGGADPHYAIYLEELPSQMYMAVGVSTNGKPYVYRLNGSTWAFLQ